MKISPIYDNLIYESKIQSLIISEHFYNTIKEYYTMEGNYVNDAKAVNELYNTLNEDGDFDPFGHGNQDYQVPDKQEEPICVLSISPGNTKLQWPYLSLPAGYTCPAASVCKSYAAKPGTKFPDGTSIKAGKDREFMCYAARQQAQYSKTAGKNAFTNLTFLQEANKNGGVDGMAKLIIDSIKFHGHENSKIFRIHEGGDFFSSDYMKAWIQVAKTLSNITFYTHTTSLDFWIANKGSMPSNFRLIASMDKNNEQTILQHDLRYAKVVYSVEEAQQLRLAIDYDDTLACCGDKSFALLIHGQQPKGSKASKAVGDTRKSGTIDKIKALHKANKGNRDAIMNKR